ncbi:acyl transferase [bacterium SCSIO 12741]|nr:acyl transferase [bacterium SCSIO 12741]
MSLDFLDIRSPQDFEEQALSLYHKQVQSNAVYGEFKDRLMGNRPVQRLEDIPYLPVSFFKSHSLKTGEFEPEAVFTSSSTTGQTPSRHEVRSLKLYEETFFRAFEQFYGRVEDWTVLALLPSYLERQGSSLVYMAEKLIERSQAHESGFYLYNHEELYQTLSQLEGEGRKTLLLGVTFGLLDFAEKFSLNFKHTVIMETGGMKGKRKELIRQEVHELLQQSFGSSPIHSEYGMTELMSQAYSDGNGIYRTPPWMKISVRSSTDPLSLLPKGKSGGINIIDLANQDSCAFLSTQDLGRILPDDNFAILGRFDNSDVRGCNLMVV